MLMLDTDVLIDIQRKHPPAVAWFVSLAEAPSVACFVAMELVQGARDGRRVRESLQLLSTLPLVWPTPADCQRAFDDFAAFHLSDGLGLLDALIAAVTVGLSAELCTFNSRHFRAVPGLVTVQPYTR